MRKSLACLAMTLTLSLLGCPPPCDGPDPEATAIEYKLLSVTSSTSGTVRITGRIRNDGMETYVSDGGQQSIQLFEDNELVAEAPFTFFLLNGTITVTYERLWSLSDEFRPQSYTVVIAYDPDIFIDGNPGNDDCNLDNNEFERSTVALDALFTP